MAEPDAGAVIDKMLKILDGIDYDKPRPTTMRCHPDVIERLRASLPAHEPSPFARHIGAYIGIAIVPDDTYGPGEWRVLDQHGEVMQESVMAEFARLGRLLNGGSDE